MGGVHGVSGRGAWGQVGGCRIDSRKCVHTIMQYAF